MTATTQRSEAHPLVDDCLGSVADRVGREVGGSAALGLHKISKVTSIHHAFRDNDTAPGWPIIKHALGDHGVLVETVPLDSGRNGGVNLLPVGQPTSVAMRPVDLQVTRWCPGIPGEVLSPDAPEPAGPGEILWFHITAAPPPTADVPAALDVVVHDLSEQLVSWGLDVERDMLLDLLTPDPQPKVDTYGDERTGIRHVSAMAVIARELADTDDEFDAVDEQLVFQLVENLVGQNWIVSCWHPARLLASSASGHSEGAPSSPALSLLQEPFIQQVRRQWGDQGNLWTSGDLGMALARELAHTYAASQRMIERWVQRTEGQFFDGLANEVGEGRDSGADEIRHMLSIVGEFRRCLTAFEHARTATADRTWFPRLSSGPTGADDSVAQLTDIIDGAQKKLGGVFGAIRADMDLLMLQSMGRQQRASQDQKRASEDLQDRLTKVTVLFLVPTLVAGIFGANTELPGLGSWFGFALMLVLMVLFSIAVYVVIMTTRGTRRRAATARSSHRSPSAEPPSV
jgi:CorA-like Mg2+ transporter protein